MRRFKIVVTHGEGSTLFQIVDASQPECNQPAVIQTFGSRFEARAALEPLLPDAVWAVPWREQDLAVLLNAEVPMFTGREAYRALFAGYGIPNGVGVGDDSPWNPSMTLFVDDDRDGEPVAWWKRGG